MKGHQLTASAETVHVGRMDAADPAVLTVRDGDEVELSTWNHFGHAVQADTRVDDLPAIRERFPDVGPHSLTGPIRIDGAEPGDVLRVDIVELRPRKHGFNLRMPGAAGRGLLHDRFQHGQLTHFELDAETMTTTFAGLAIELRPFLGFMGVLPADDGTWNSRPPGRHGGNLDLKELVAGTALLLPVSVAGGFFYAGDAHAVQGDGEVNLTAIETSLEVARLRFSVVPGARVTSPIALTGDDVFVTGFGESLDEAAADALDTAVDLLSTTCGLSEDEAYVLSSLAVDLRITQVVNGVKGVHARLPRRVLAARFPSWLEL